MDRYLFGKLNNEIKQREYKGLPTETTETIVDNADNTIKVEIKNPITIEDNGEYITLTYGGVSYKLQKCTEE